MIQTLESGFEKVNLGLLCFASGWLIITLTAEIAFLSYLKTDISRLISLNQILINATGIIFNYSLRIYSYRRVTFEYFNGVNRENGTLYVANGIKREYIEGITANESDWLEGQLKFAIGKFRKE